MNLSVLKSTNGFIFLKKCVCLRYLKATVSTCIFIKWFLKLLYWMAYLPKLYWDLKIFWWPYYEDVCTPLVWMCLEELCLCTAALHGSVLECCASEMPQYFSFKTLVPNARACSEHIYCVDITGGDFSSLSIVVSVCMFQYWWTIPFAETWILQELYWFNKYFMVLLSPLGKES